MSILLDSEIDDCLSCGKECGPEGDCHVAIEVFGGNQATRRIALCVDCATLLGEMLRDELPEWTTGAPR